MQITPQPADHEVLRIIMNSLPAIIVAVGAFIVNVWIHTRIRTIDTKVDTIEKNTNSINQALQAKVDAGVDREKDQERIIAAQLQAPSSFSK